MHDLKHKNEDMDKIRKDLIKINKQLKKKHQEAELMKDPQAALSDFVNLLIEEA